MILITQPLNPVVAEHRRRLIATNNVHIRALSSAINSLVANDLYDRFDMLCLAGLNGPDTLLSINNPLVNSGVVGAPAYTFGTGFLITATDYINTGIVLDDSDIDDNSMFVYTLNNGATGGALIGAYDASTSANAKTRIVASTEARIANHNSTLNATTFDMLPGFVGMSRSSPAVVIYAQSDTVSTVSQSSTSIVGATTPVYVGASSTSSGFELPATGANILCWGVGKSAGTTTGDLVALRDIIETYMASMSSSAGLLYVPQNVVATANTSTYVTVSWDALVVQGDATDYRVLYSPERTLAASVPFGTNTVDITVDVDSNPIVASTEYSFIVVSTDGTVSESADSAIASVTTPGTVSAGSGLTIKNPKTVTGWTFADPSTASTEPGIGLLITNPRTISGLRFVDPTGALPDPVPVQPPTITSLQSASSSTLLLGWTDNQTIAPDLFTVHCVRTTDSVSAPQYPKQISGTLSTHTITGLNPATSYDVTMTASVGVATSAFSNSLTATTSTVVVIPPGAWKLPDGYFTPAQQPPRIVYPRPPNETHPDARYKWAHSGMEYSICVGVQFGSWPFYYELIDSPTGMTIGSTYGSTQSPNADYGVIRWPAASIPSSGTYTVTVRITDQEYTVATIDGSITDVTFTVTVDDSKFYFLDKNGSGVGTQADPDDDISDAWSVPNKIIVLKDSANNYTMTTDKSDMNRAVNSFSWIAEQYNPSLEIDFGARGYFNVNNNTDFLAYGLHTTGISAGGPDINNKAWQGLIRNGGDRTAVHRNTFTNIWDDGLFPESNVGILVLTVKNPSHLYVSFIRNTIDGISKKYFVYDIYACYYTLTELNVLRNAYNGPHGTDEGWFFHKGTCRWSTFRANDCWDVATQILQFRVTSTGMESPGGEDQHPSYEECCWNRMYENEGTDSQRLQVLSTHVNVVGVTPALTKGYSVYRNTIMGYRSTTHVNFGSGDATQLLDNVALTATGGLCLGGNSFSDCSALYGTYNISNNIEGNRSGQTTINETTGILTDETKRGLAGHEVVVVDSLFAPDIANMTFEQFAVGSSAIISGSQTGTIFNTAGTGGKVWDISGLAKTSISDSVVFSGTRSAELVVVSPTEPVNDPTRYSADMGVQYLLPTSQRLYKGDEFWVRFMLYLPSNFDSTTGTNLKFIMLERDDPTGVNNGSLFYNMEGGETTYGGWFNGSEVNTGTGSSNYSPYSKFGVIPIAESLCWHRGEWQSIEAYGYCSDVVGETITRFWINNNLVYESTGVPVLAKAAGWISGFKLFPYWNGANTSATIPQFTGSIHIDDFKITSNLALPLNFDASGNRYIGGSTG